MDNLLKEGELRNLILELVKGSFSGDWEMIKKDVVKRVEEENLGSLGPQGEQRVNQAIISLIIEQLVTIHSPKAWPSIMLTDLGKSWAQDKAKLKDPDGYAAFLRETAPNVEQATVEYAVEALKCLQQNLLFPCAVMIGAAAEREIVRLGKAIFGSEPREQETKKLKDALERGRLPALFQEIFAAVNKAVQGGSMQYSVHQGVTEHLLSFQEMIRVQRNDAVHSGAAGITKEKVFLSLQTFPVALGAIDRLRSWFEEKHAN